MAILVTMSRGRATTDSWTSSVEVPSVSKDGRCFKKATFVFDPWTEGSVSARSHHGSPGSAFTIIVFKRNEKK